MLRAGRGTYMPASAVADDFELQEAMYAGSDPEGDAR